MILTNDKQKKRTAKMKTITKNLDFIVFNVSMVITGILAFSAIYAFYLNGQTIKENFRRPAVVSMTKIK